MKWGVAVFPGSNCDQDCIDVLRNVLHQQVVPLWHQETALRGCDAVILPGGFSYGDYLRTGAIARFSPIMRAVASFAKGGGLVIGICNGFQILLESGLLPGAMLRNTGLRFICKFITLRVERTDTPFTNRFQQGQVIRLPIAHNEGRYATDANTLRQVREQVVFRYPLAGPVERLCAWLVDLLCMGGLMLALHWLVMSTPLGRAMRAIAQDPTACRLLGIPVDRIIAITFALGSALAHPARSSRRAVARRRAGQRPCASRLPKFHDTPDA